MSTQMESSLWSRQKQDVVQSFIDNRKKLVSTTAGKGFTLAPGFLYEYETGLEIDTKQKLSEINFKILSGAIERDIKQAGIDYDILYRNAAIAWEIDKQTILTAWDKELATVKSGWAREEERLRQLAIEVSLREVLFLEAKTEIELDMEALRAELAAVEDNTADYEVMLIKQKIITATKKLEVIPILQSILNIEAQILVKEQSLVRQEEQIAQKENEKIIQVELLIDAETLVSDTKKSELIPVIMTEIESTKRLNTAIETETEFEKQIAAQKLLTANAQLQKSNKQLLITNKEVEIEDVVVDIQEIDVEKAEKRVDIMAIEKDIEGLQVELTDIAITEVNKKLEIAEVELEIDGKQIEIVGVNVDKTEKQIELLDKELTETTKQVSISEVKVEQERKQVELINKDIDYEVRSLELLDVQIDQEEQKVAIAEQDIQYEEQLLEKSRINLERITKQLELDTKELETVSENVSQLPIKQDIAEQAYAAEYERTTVSRNNTIEFSTLHTTLQETELTTYQRVQSMYYTTKTSIEDAKMAEKGIEAQQLASARVYATTYAAARDADTITGEANINAARELTAQLTHLIG